MKRRTFARSAFAASLGFQVVPSRVFGANSRPTLAGIGIGGKGQTDIKNSESVGFQIVALVDVVDPDRMGNVGGRLGSVANTRRAYPSLPFYQDWREMFDSMGDRIDAVTVSTPNHATAHACLAAMRAGKHVFAQKPIAHDIREARALAEAAAQSGVKTQMGNQAQAYDQTRRVVELLRAGVIGEPTEFHGWSNAPKWPQGFHQPPSAEPVPDWLDWEQWIGPQPFVDYSSKIAPFAWRGWWDYGNGGVGDMTPHLLDHGFRAFSWQRPLAMRAEQRGETQLAYPIESTVALEMESATGGAPVTVHWHEGAVGARFDNNAWTLTGSSGRIPAPDHLFEGRPPHWRDKFGSVLIGTEGRLWYHRSKESYCIERDRALESWSYPPASLPRVPNEDLHREFYDAVMGTIEQAESHFGYAAPFIEAMLVACLAQRAPGERLEWDFDNLTVKGRPDLAPHISPAYRSGWDLPA